MRMSRKAGPDYSLKRAMAVLLSVGTLAAHANAGEEEKFFGCWAPPQNKELPGQGNEICFKPHGEVEFIHFEPSLVEGFVYQWKLLGSNKIKLGSDTIAVGTRVTPRPPHRSGQAQLRHPVPTSGVWRRNAHQARDEGFSVWEGSPWPASPSCSRASYPSGSAAEAFVAIAGRCGA